ncbi:MAG: dihydrodipicolinate synthase family protein, partial [bacterium]
TSPPFSVLSGDDPLTLPLMALGAVGVISVVSNLYPRTLKGMVNAALTGDFPTARAINQRLLPLYRTLFIETNPGPIKAAMNLKGIPVGEVRPPLAPVKRETLKAIRQALHETEDLE